MNQPTLTEKRNPEVNLSDLETVTIIGKRLNKTPPLSPFNHREDDEALDYNGATFGDALRSLCNRGLLIPTLTEHGEGIGYRKTFAGSVNLEHIMHLPQKPVSALPGAISVPRAKTRNRIGVANSEIKINGRRGSLTPSEAKFAILVGRGLSTSDACEAVQKDQVKKRTGDFHLSNFTRKVKDGIEERTGVRPARLSRVRAVMFAVRSGWIEALELVDPQFPKPPKVYMSPMEYAVATRLVLGMSAKETALDLAASDPHGEYSKRTVDFHTADLFTKFSFEGREVKNRLQLFQALLQQHLWHGLKDQPNPNRPVNLRLPELKYSTALALPMFK